MAATKACVLRGAAELKILHALEKPEQLLRLRVVIKTGAIERAEQFVGGLQRREAACFRLPLDDEAARRRV